jgi:hypothetical protein
MNTPDYVERFLEEIIETCQRFGLILTTGVTFDTPNPHAPGVSLLTGEKLARLKQAECDSTVPAKRCEHYDEGTCWRPAAKLVDGSPRCILHTPTIKDLS